MGWGVCFGGGAWGGVGGSAVGGQAEHERKAERHTKPEHENVERKKRGSSMQRKLLLNDTAAAAQTGRYLRALCLVSHALAALFRSPASNWGSQTSFSQLLAHLGAVLGEREDRVGDQGEATPRRRAGGRRSERRKKRDRGEAEQERAEEERAVQKRAVQKRAVQKRAEESCAKQSRRELCRAEKSRGKELDNGRRTSSSLRSFLCTKGSAPPRAHEMVIAALFTRRLTRQQIVCNGHRL